MSRIPRFFPLTLYRVQYGALLIPLLLILLLPSMSSEAAPALGITPTATPTVTPTPTARPTVRPTQTPIPPSGEPDLVIVKRGDPLEALPGEEVTFTLEVTNQGQAAAVDVVVTDDVPQYLEILEVTTTQGTVTIEGQTVTVEVGVVGPGFVVEIVIRTRLREDTPAPLNLENVAVLVSANAGQRTSLPVIIYVPGLLPVTGRLLALWLAYVILGGGLAALGIRLGKRKLAR